MAREGMSQPLTETHHALLFGWLSKNVIEEVGEQRGKAVISKAVRKYGEQRGKRMALRARAAGQTLDVAGFLAYAEYRAVTGKLKSKVVERSANFSLEASNCPWYDAWKENGLLPYGRLYCLDVDAAILHGFNADLRMDVEATLSNGAEKCRLVYHEANLTLFRYLLLGYRRAVRPGKTVVMPWDYHVGHLFKTLQTSMIEDLRQSGRKALDSALQQFSQYYGESVTQQVLAFQSTDFDKVEGSNA